jgi:hypothetical protein
MSLRAADLRFTLPQAPRSAVVLGELDAWRDGLQRAGIEGGADPDLVVAPADRAQEAVALGPKLLLLDGGSPRLGGWSTQTIVPLPTPAEPELLLPAGGGNAVRYAIRRWRAGSFRNTVARELLARGMAPPGRGRVTVAARSGGPPFFAARALQELPTAEAGWFAAFGRFADPFSRGAFYLFPTDAREPEWVVKFARLPGLVHLFDSDERGLAEAARAPALVATRAPRLLTRFEIDGLHASVETAATGERLATLLERSNRARAVSEIERIAAWLVDVAAATTAGPAALEPERRRLEELLAHGLPTPPLELDGVPAVFQHGDLNAENVFVRNADFEVVDWESATTHGFPLWDLFFFLTDALAIVDGVDSEDARARHFVRLWRGELESSRVLFRWTRTLADAAAVPATALGALATALWVGYAARDSEHVARLAALEPTAAEPTTLRLARRWLSEPGLGPGWQPA